MATFSPTSALVSVDLPALGRPTRHANPDRNARPAPAVVSRGRPAGRRRGVGLGRRRRRGARPRSRAGCAGPRAVGDQHEPVDLGARARDRHPAERLGEQAADGVDLLVLEVEAEQLADLLDVHAASAPGSEPSPRSSTSVSSRSYSSAISPTISSTRSSSVTMPAVPPYSSTTIATCAASRCISRSRSSAALLSGTKCAGRIDRVDRHAARPRSRVLVQPAGDVLEVQHPADVVQPLAHHGDPGEPGAQEQRHRRAQGLPRLDAHQGRARHHDLAHEGVAELEDGVDHLALAGLDQLALLGDVDELAQLRLARERPVPEARPGREHVADEHEQARQRPEHPGEGDHHGRRHQADAVRVLAAEGARADADRDEAQRRHGGDRDGTARQPLPRASRNTTVSSTAAPDSASTRRKVDTESVGAGSSATRASACGAAAALAEQLAGPCPGDPRERRLGRRQRAGQHDEDERDDDEAHVAGVHARPRSGSGAGPPAAPGRPARNSRRSRRCRPNISRSSSGSAWS